MFQTVKCQHSAVFIHQGINGTSATSKNKLKLNNKAFSKASITAHTSLDKDPEIIQTEFDNLLANVYSGIIESREKEERSIVQ